MKHSVPRAAVLCGLLLLVASCSAGPPPATEAEPSSFSSRAFAPPVRVLKLERPAGAGVGVGRAVPLNATNRAALAKSLAGVALLFPHGGAAGSGVSIGDGYILTNDHVAALVPRDRQMDVYLDGGRYKARVVARDLFIDIALVKIDTKKKLPFLELGDSDKVAVGDWVIAIGNAKATGTSAHRSSCTLGILAGKHRITSPVGAREYYRYSDGMQLDVPLHPGNSGGALVDMAGRLIGINGAGSASGTQGLAIPINQIKRYLPTMKAGVNNSHADMQLEGRPLTLTETKRIGRGGSRVKKITNPNGASKNLRAGDIILALGDHPIRSELARERAVDLFNPNDIVAVQLLRKGKRITRNVRMAQLIVDKGKKRKELLFIQVHGQALANLMRKHYGIAQAGFHKAIQIMPDSDTAYYNLACCQSLMGNVSGAIASLRRAYQLGMPEVDMIKRDPDLKNVRKDKKRFDALYKELKAKEEE